MVPPVFSATKVEHDGLALFLVFDQEGEGGHVHGLMAFLDRLHESPGWDDDICGGVYNGDVYTVVAFRQIEGGCCLWFDVLF